MRCAATVFLSSARPTVPASVADEQSPCAIGASPADEAQSWDSLSQRRTKLPLSRSAAVCRPSSSSSPVGYARPLRSRAPRPITVRQLCRAILGFDLTGKFAAMAEPSHFHVWKDGSAENVPQRVQVDEDASFSATSMRRSMNSRYITPRHSAVAARLGESTVIVDGKPCHRVVVCGRVVRYVDAVANGSAHPAYLTIPSVAAAAEAVALNPPAAASAGWTMLSSSGVFSGGGGGADAQPGAGGAPYDLLWISDGTGLIGILRPLSTIPTPSPRPTVDGGGWYAAVASRGAEVVQHRIHGEGGGYGAAEMESEEAASYPYTTVASVYVEKPPLSTSVSIAVTDKSVAARAVGPPCGRRDDRPYRERAGPTVEAQHVERYQRWDDAVAVNDNIVCVGALVFGDVDMAVTNAWRDGAAELRRCLWASATAPSSAVAAALSLDYLGSHMPLPGGCGVPRPPSSAKRRIDSLSGFAERDDAVDHHQHLLQRPGEVLPGEAARQAPDAPSANPSPATTFVLLAGSAVPLTLQAAREELGVVGPLPPHTRYLTAAEASRWGCADDGAARPAPSSGPLQESSTPVAQGDPPPVDGDGARNPDRLPLMPRNVDCSTRAVDATVEVPLVCLRGQCRAVYDTNECLYWWLAAVEAHLRQRAREATSSFSS